MENYYISFDQSLTKTGFCIWKNGEIYKHGVINEQKDKTNRFERMSVQIIDIIQQYSPTVITIEQTALQSNAKTLRELAQLQGAIMGYCVMNNIYYEIWEPTKWRSVLGFKGKRAELKQMAIEWVFQIYGIVATEDEAESICIGAAVLSQFREV